MPNLICQQVEFFDVGDGNLARSPAFAVDSIELIQTLPVPAQ
ncbi:MULTISPECIES: hypothetical protein [Cyanophyceae]|nr:MULTISPECIES: hypothetical protein [Cyanophyceae]